MKRMGRFAWVFLLGSATVLHAQTASEPTVAAENYSGMYTFLKEGEFVQITVEEAGRVTGFVSRYGDGESDRGAFLDHFFKQGKLDGTRLNFTTETVHSVRYEFNGAFERGSGKTPADEAYHLVKGTLTEYREGADKKATANSREVTFKSFPRDLSTTPAPGN
ncbi:MAG: hypothetical protein WB952_16305 [Terriglobales bacterium]